MLGAGTVGLVTGACLATLGHEVVVRDVDEHRIAGLDRGNLPSFEPGLAELLACAGDRISFTTTAIDAESPPDVVVVAVGTPRTSTGAADLSAVWTVVDGLPRSPRRFVLVMKSTVPVGTGARIRSVLEQRGLDNVGYVSNPEFLAEGTGVHDFQEPDRIVIGTEEPGDGELVAGLYEGLNAPIVLTDLASAEMIKLASNAFLSTRISFINEIANVCELVGADVTDVARGMGLDHRLGGHFLRAGIGFGGSCFPKDVSALKELAGDSGYHFHLLASVIQVNENQRTKVLAKLRNHLGELHGREVALLGVAFKPGTDDTREAPSRDLAARLLGEGALVRAWDPLASLSVQGVAECATVEEAVTGADAAVVVTEWPQLRGLIDPTIRDLMAQPVIIDGRNLLDPEAARAAGFVYEGIGRPAPTP